MPEEPARRARLPLVIAITIVATLAMAYYFYVRAQRAYFASRNLRLLATISNQLDDALRTTEGFVRNYGGSRYTPKTYARASNRASTETSDTDPAIFLPNFETAVRNCEPAGANAMETGPAFRRTLDRGGEHARLTIAYSENFAPPEPVAAPNAEAPPPRVRTPGDPCFSDGIVLQSATATIPLPALLEPLFAQSLLSAFDDIMLVRGDGSVLYTDHQHTRGALSLRGEEDSVSEQTVINLGELAERSGWRETKKLELRALRETSRISEVETPTGTYFLFTQPFPHDTVDADLGAPQKEGRRWILAGMVSKRRFMYEVLSVSGTGVLIVSALLLTMMCAWPYLRISLIGQHQRISIADVLLLGFAALIHASILTLVVLDILAYRSLRAVSDRQLELFAQRVEDDLYSDLESGAQTLTALDAWARDPQAQGRWTRSDLATYQAAEASIVALKLPNPYVSSVAWIDGRGRQRYKLTMRQAAPLVNVAYRGYFRNARMNRLHQLGDDPRSAVAIESIRSSTTGDTQAVIARPTAARGLSVVAATVDLVHIAHPVLPPGYGFAIIANSGNVVFHSEKSRNNQENFFAETDWNRTVRSAVFARHAVRTNVRYWGASHRVYVQPLVKLPWTLVVFREKSLLRTVNTEAVAMTLSMLLGNAAIYLVVIVILLLWKPHYRAPLAWPVPANGPLYARLVVLYVVTIASASLVFYAFDPRSVLLITMLVPAQALAGTMVVLERQRMPLRWRVALAVWVALTLLWVFVLLSGTAMRGTMVTNQLLLMKAAGLLLVTATAWATFRVARKPFDVGHDSTAYLAAGALLLVVGAVIPTFGFFKVASRLEIEGLVKYSQLVIADRAERSIVGIEASNVSDAAQEAHCDTWEGDPFRTKWQLVPPMPQCRAMGTLKPPQATLDEGWLPDVYRDVLPAYSEESVSLRQLHGSSDRGGRWEWWWHRERITLVKPVRLPETEESFQGAGISIYGSNPPPQQIHVQSRVPLSFAAAWRYDEGWSSRSAIWLVTFLVGVAGVLGALHLIVRFFARRLFLADIREPLWLMPPPPLKPTLGDHVLLVRRTKSVEELTAAREEKLDFVDVKFETMEKGSLSAWDDALIAIDRAAEGKNVRIFDFEHGVTNAGTSMRKLTFLERLLASSNRPIVMASTISPPTFLALVTNADLRRRWTAVFDRFVAVTESHLESVPDDAYPPRSRNNVEWLHYETRQGAFLRGLRAELEPIAKSADREQLEDEILERSNAYYASLWAACSPDEKILLHQLAREGLMNGKDRKSVRRLLARGLVRRGPNLRLFNDTFRLYVLAVARRDQVPFETHDEPSAWDMIRLPLFVMIVSLVILVFATQKDLLNLTTGLVAALTTGLPAIVRLFGFFADRRAASAEKT